MFYKLEFQRILFNEHNDLAINWNQISVFLNHDFSVYFPTNVFRMILKLEKWWKNNFLA